MRRDVCKKLVFCILSLGLWVNASGQDTTRTFTEYLRSTRISGQWFLAYRYHLSDDVSRFYLKRGYLNFTNNLTEQVSVRFTQDITVDREGQDAGNLELKLKYLYLKVHDIGIELLPSTYLEIGMVHRPWIDYEQSVNRYRLQSKMFAEEAGLINSADLGLMFGGLIGGRIDSEYRNKVNASYPGRYGSYALGVYNGGGYSAIESNRNKTLEGRLTLRPLPDYVPGLQGGYSFALGKGNTTQSPDFRLHLFYISWESKFSKLLVQFINAKGNAGGSFVDAQGLALKNEGISAFAEAHVPGLPLSIMGRYDYFEAKANSMLNQESLSGGLAWHIRQFGKALLFYEKQTIAGRSNRFAELALEIAF